MWPVRGAGVAVALSARPGNQRNAASALTVSATASVMTKGWRFMRNLLIRHHVSLLPMSS
jgi:hypothetical protein